MSITGTCAQPFDANSDVSGLGIFIAFYTQGLLFLVFGISTFMLQRYGTLLRGDKHLHTWVEARALDMHNNWVAAGIVMIIAAFSQWRTISMFHLFLCANLSSTVPITVQFGKDNNDHSKRTRVQYAYFIFYGILRIAISAFYVYRLRFWSTTPGQCFVIPVIIPYTDGVKAFLAWTAIRITEEVMLVLALLYSQCVSFLVPERNMEKQISHQKDPQEEKLSSPTQGLSSFKAPKADGPLILNAYCTIRVLLANRGHVLGGEYTFTFGQVGALVALVASLYGTVSSYLEYREQRRASSTGDAENLKENKLLEAPETTTPEEHTPLPTTAAESKQVPTDRLAFDLVSPTV